MERAFTEREALGVAMEMEKRGMALYRRAVRVSASAEAVALLTRLEHDEREHYNQFAALYERRAGDARADEETGAYLSAIAADVVFPGGLTDMAQDAGMDDPARILHHAAQAERDGIAFYGRMAARAQSDEERATFLSIAAQEEHHLEALERMMTEEEV